MTRDAGVTLQPSTTERVGESYDAFWLDDGVRYVQEGTEPGRLVYDVSDVALEEFESVWFDVLAEGAVTPNFELTFAADDASLTSRLLPGRDGGRECGLWFRVLPECTVRCGFSLDLLDQTEYQLPRSGGRLKTFVGGDRVEPADVDRIELSPRAADDQTWCQTPLSLERGEPPELGDPDLPSGALLDEFGQWTLDDWEGKTATESTLVSRLERQREAAETEFAGERSEWGGWTGTSFEATGFFRTHHDGDRWWLVDPDGHPFLSIGLNTVQPRHLTAYDGLTEALEWLPDDDEPYGETRYDYEGEPVVNYLRANLIRAFGPDEWRTAWRESVFPKLQAWGFNTAAAWSDDAGAREHGLPYTRCLDPTFEHADEVFKGLPDPYDDAVREDASAIAAQLEETASDPSLIGYYIGDYGGWALDAKPPAEGMLERSEALAAREALADFLREEYGTDEALGDAWDADVTFEGIAAPQRVAVSSEAAREDLVAFSERLVERLYRILDEACRAVDEHHLNLGTRFNGIPRRWALASLEHADAFTTYLYGKDVASLTEGPTPGRGRSYGRISERYDVPVLVAEWQHGALDVGLPYYGRYRVQDQRERGKAYRHYFEQAIAEPWCIGSHYFQLYDQSAVGRPDGENGNVGLFDVCHRPYRPLVDAAETSHRRAYEVAAGREQPFEWDWNGER